MDEGFLINTECYDLSDALNILIAVLSLLTAVSVATLIFLVVIFLKREKHVSEILKPALKKVLEQKEEKWEIEGIQRNESLDAEITEYMSKFLEDREQKE